MPARGSLPEHTTILWICSSRQQHSGTFSDSLTILHASVWHAVFPLYLRNGTGRDFITSSVGCCYQVVKKKSLSLVSRSGSPELYKGKSLDNIAFVSRKSRSEKYELTNRKKKKKKEFGQRNPGSGIPVHRGLNNGNGFEQECVRFGIWKEKTAFVCSSAINVESRLVEVVGESLLLESLNNGLDSKR